MKKTKLLSIISLASLLGLSSCSFSEIEGMLKPLTPTEQPSEAHPESAPSNQEAISSSSSANHEYNEATRLDNTFLRKAIKSALEAKTITINFSGGIGDESNRIKGVNSTITLAKDDGKVTAYADFSGDYISDGEIVSIKGTGVIEENGIYVKFDNMPTQSYGSYEGDKYICTTATGSGYIYYPLSTVTGASFANEFIANYEVMYDYLLNDLYPFVNGVLDYVDAEFASASEAFFDYFFDITTTPTGYSVRLDNAAVWRFLKKINGNSLPNIFDFVLGSGQYSSVKEQISEIYNSKFSDLTDKLNAYGADIFGFYNRTEEIYNIVTNESFEKQLGADLYDIMIDAYKNNLSVGQFICKITGGDSTNLLDQLFNNLEEYTFDCPLDEDVSNFINNSLGFTFNTYKDGTLDNTTIFVDYFGNNGFDATFNTEAYFSKDYKPVIDESVINSTSDVIKNIKVNKNTLDVLGMNQGNIGYDSNGYVITHSYKNNEYDLTNAMYTVTSLCNNQYYVSVEAPCTNKGSTYIRNFANYVVNTTNYNVSPYNNNPASYHNISKKPSRVETSGEGCTASTISYYTCNDCGNDVIVNERSSHDMQESFRLLGNSCEDGIEVGYTCSKCGYSDKKAEIYYEHYTTETKIDLSEYGIDEYLYYYSCACGQKFEGVKPSNYKDYKEDKEYDAYIQYYYYDNNSYLMIKETYKSIDACNYSRSWKVVAHNGKTNTDTTLVDVSKVDANHYYYTESTKLVGKTCEDGVYVTQKCYNCDDEKTILAYNHQDMYRNNELKNPNGNCEDGIIVSYFCTTCGVVEKEYETYGHEVTSHYIDLSNIDSRFSGKMYYGACACGQEFWDLKYEYNDYEYSYNYDNDTSYDIYTLKNGCSIKLVRKQTGNESCSTSYEHSYQLVDANGNICYSETVGTREEVYHNYKEVDTKLYGKTCEDGVEVSFKCVNCNETKTEKYGWHYSTRTKAELVNPNGTCENGIYVWEECSICGAKCKEYTTYGHNVYERIIDLASQGIDGYIYIYECPCGMELNDVGFKGNYISCNKTYDEKTNKYFFTYALEEKSSLVITVKVTLDNNSNYISTVSYEILTQEENDIPTFELTDADILNGSDVPNRQYTSAIYCGIFTINAAESSNVVVDANNKTYDGVTYTSRIKLGGTGYLEYRSISIDLSELEEGKEAIITVVCMSSSAAADRTANLYEYTTEDLTEKVITNEETQAKATKGTPVDEDITIGSTLDGYTFVVEAGMYYFASTSGGINVYAIIIEYLD